MKMRVKGLKSGPKNPQTIMIQYLKPAEEGYDQHPHTGQPIRKKPRKITLSVKNGDEIDVPDQIGYKIMTQYERYLEVIAPEQEEAPALPKVRSRVSVPAKNKIAPEAK